MKLLIDTIQAMISVSYENFKIENDPLEREHLKIRMDALKEVCDIACEMRKRIRKIHLSSEKEQLQK